MKRFLTCALCFISLPAIAVTLYYEQDGACPGLYSYQPSLGCPTSGVSRLNVTPMSNTVFNGYFVDGSKIVNADGTFTNNAMDTLLGANLVSGTEIPQTYTCSNGVTETGYGECESNTPLVTVKLDTRGGSLAAPAQVRIAHGGTLTAYAPDRSSFDGAIFVGWAKSGQPDSTANKNAVVNATAGTTVTYRAVYTCPGDRYMNQYDVCVSDEDEYITPDGNPVYPNDLQCWRQTGPGGSYQNYCHWNLRITIHNNTQGFSVLHTTNPVNYGDLNEGMVLDCYGGQGCSSYALLYIPKAEDYIFRGYFNNVKNPNDLIVSEDTFEGGAFSVFYPKNQNSQTMSITGHAVVVVEPVSTVPLDCVGGEWITRPDGSQYCTGEMRDTNQWPIEIYGGWARKCAQQNNPFLCDVIIGSSFTPVAGFGKGDVDYRTSCEDGYTLQPETNNTYNPICEKEENDISITYQFVDQYGFELSNCGMDSATCGINGTYNLPYRSICGSGYTLKYLGTYSGFYTPSHQVSCSSNVFGTTPATRIVTGYVCRHSCNLGETIANGYCAQASQYGGVLNGNEVLSNIWNGCNRIFCDSGYKVQEVSSSVECVHWNP